MSIYTKIYNNLCESKKVRSNIYGHMSELHVHHIIPRHMGGSDDISNITYLYVKEHIIAHFLLYKMYANPNDLRAMKMLGANLTVKQRSIIGKYCRDNNIGFHNPKYDQHRTEWAMRGYTSQKESQNTNNFYWWSTKEGQKKRASMGGKAALKSGNNTQFEYWMSPEGQKKRASMGAKSHIGKKCMYKPGDTTFKRVRPEDIDSYLNNGYVFGSPLKGKNQHTCKD